MEGDSIPLALHDVRVEVRLQYQQNRIRRCRPTQRAIVTASQRGRHVITLAAVFDVKRQRDAFLDVSDWSLQSF
jgi:hypothetical protein